MFTTRRLKVHGFHDIAWGYTKNHNTMNGFLFFILSLYHPKIIKFYSKSVVKNQIYPKWSIKGLCSTSLHIWQHCRLASNRFFRVTVVLVWSVFCVWFHSKWFILMLFVVDLLINCEKFPSSFQDPPGEPSAEEFTAKGTLKRCSRFVYAFTHCCITERWMCSLYE